MRERRKELIRPGLALLSASALLVAATAMASARHAEPLVARREAPTAAGGGSASAADPVPIVLASTVSIHLCAKEGTLALPGLPELPELPETNVAIWGFVEMAGADCSGEDAGVPGPVIRATVGDTVEVTLHNGLSEEVSIAFSGEWYTPTGDLLVPDDVVVGPGGQETYTFVASAPGTYLYQAGTNPAVQVPMGLYGALVVDPSTAGQAYDGLETAYDVDAVLVLSEIDPLLNASPGTFDMLDYHPTYWLINGEAYPYTDPIAAIAGDRVLLRYVNAGLVHDTMMLLGTRQRVVARDAFELPFAFDAISETIPTGQTVDAIATMPSEGSFPLYNRQLQLTNGDAGDFPGGMLTFITATAV